MMLNKSQVLISQGCGDRETDPNAGNGDEGECLTENKPLFVAEKKNYKTTCKNAKLGTLNMNLETQS